MHGTGCPAPTTQLHTGSVIGSADQHTACQRSVLLPLCIPRHKHPSPNLATGLPWSSAFRHGLASVFPPSLSCAGRFGLLLLCGSALRCCSPCCLCWLSLFPLPSPSHYTSCWLVAACLRCGCGVGTLMHRCGAFASRATLCYHPCFTDCRVAGARPHVGGHAVGTCDVGQMAVGHWFRCAMASCGTAVHVAWMVQQCSWRRLCAEAHRPSSDGDSCGNRGADVCESPPSPVA